MLRAASYNCRFCLPPASTLAANSPSTAATLALIANDMREVDEVIASRLQSSVPLVGDVARYIISAGGKRLRPALLLLVSGRPFSWSIAISTAMIISAAVLGMRAR